MQTLEEWLDEKRWYERQVRRGLADGLTPPEYLQSTWDYAVDHIRLYGARKKGPFVEDDALLALRESPEYQLMVERSLSRDIRERCAALLWIAEAEGKV